MAYDGAGWDETIPTNATIANEIDDVARDMKIAVRSRMAVEHVWPASQSATSSAGYHIYVSLSGQTGAPSLPVAGTAGTQAGLLWAGTDGSLNYVHSSGTSVGLVSAAGTMVNSSPTYTANAFIVNSVATGPTIGTDQGGFYAKNVGTQTEGFFRSESDGSETQLTSLGAVKYDKATFGSWISRSEGTDYEATTDGIVTAYGVSGGTDDITIDGYTDDASSPTTRRAYATVPGKNISITFPVKSGDYWRVDGSGIGASFTVFWIPLD